MKEHCTAVVLAAGRGTRMGTQTAKQYLELQGKPILVYALEVFEQSAVVDDILLMTDKDHVEYCKKEICEKYGIKKVSAVAPGGKERYDSVYEGLKACKNCDYVFIHDGARPFVTEEMINRGKKTVIACGTCVLGMPSKDTVKIIGENGFVESTPKRDKVWNVQTPQIFSYPDIYKAYQEAKKQGMQGITDDAMVMEQYGALKVRLEEGSYENIKITTPEDILLAEKILETLEKE